LWKWCHFFFEQALPDSSMLKTISLEGMHDTYVICMRLVSCMASIHKELHQIICATTGLITMVTKLWLQEVKVGKEHLDFHASTVLYRFTKHPIIGTAAHWLSVVVDAAGGDYKTTASISLQRILLILEKPFRSAPNYFALEADILIATSFVSAGSDTFRAALLDQQSTKILTKTMYRLALSTQSGELTSQIVSCLRLCAMYLRFFTGLVTYRNVFVLEAMDAQLHPALLGSSRWFSHDNLTGSEGSLQTYCCDLMSGILPHYLVYRSVLRTVSRSLKKIKALDLEAQVSRESPLWKLWVQFRGIATERLMIKSAVKSSPIASCDNPGVCCSSSSERSY
jgi:hypothetical protein